MIYFSSMISNKGFTFFVILQAMCFKLVMVGWSRKTFKLSTTLFLSRQMVQSISPYLADFWGFYWDYRQKKLFCITRGTKNEVISGFWHNIQILSVLQRNSRNFGGRSSCYHSHLSLFLCTLFDYNYSYLLIINIITALLGIVVHLEG